MFFTRTRSVFLEVEKNISRIKISRVTKARKMISRGSISSQKSFEEKDTRGLKNSRIFYEEFRRDFSSIYFISRFLFLESIFVSSRMKFKKKILYKNNLFKLKVDKSILRINWKFIKLLKLKYRIITKICIKNISN